MPSAQLATLLRHLHKLAARRGPSLWTDRQLLDNFAVRRDESAFAALVARHGPMVLRVCRRVLNHEQDAEDAFQAAFLVLARNSGSIHKPEALANWLHGVAYRIAMKAKRSAARRRHHEARLRSLTPPAVSSPTWDDVQAVLDEEIQRLPEVFRTAFVVCVLEGKSGPQAAAELDVKPGTVSSRLTRARQLLQKRLVRRGIKLSALLAALSVAESAGHAALPAVLANVTVRSGLLVATGATAAGVIPAHVGALAAGVTSAMFLTKAKMATVVLLAVSVVTGAAVLARQALFAKDNEVKNPPAKTRVPEPGKPLAAKPQPATAKNAPADIVEFSGRVIDPQGKPVARAKVYYHFITLQDEPLPVRATTDAQGRFSFSLTRKDVPLSADAIEVDDPLKNGQVIVKAAGFTYGWRMVTNQQTDLATNQRTDLRLQLFHDDTPVEGRIVDLQGKPLAGLRVSALSVAALEKGELAPFVKALQARKPFYVAIFEHFSNQLINPVVGQSLAGFLPSATTDVEGRFRLKGFARDQLLELRIEGDAIETQNLYVLTRVKPGGSAQLLTPPRRKDEGFDDDPQVLVVWNRFDHAVPPGKVVVGRVTAERTGQPIPGAVVESYMLAGTRLAGNTIYHTTADDQGRYRFTGLPRGKGNQIRIRPPKDQPFLPVVKEVPPTETFAQATVDVTLERGIWVDVKAIDKATSQPVVGYVSYFVLPDKPAQDGLFNRPYGDAYNDMMANRTDGTFRFVAAPRRAIVAFRADWEKYPIAKEAATIRLPSLISPLNYQAFAEISPKLGAGPVKVDFALSAGQVLKGKLVGPDGQPVVGALATALRDDWFWQPDSPLKTSDFTVLGFDPRRPRLLCFVHWDKKLGGSLVVRGDEKGPSVVKLEPFGTISGRLLDADGKPIKNASLAFTEVPIRKPGQQMSLDTGLHVVEHIAYKPNPDPQTDEDGRFRVEGLIPGLKYNLALMDARGATEVEQIKWIGLAFTNLVLKPGEAKDLGEVKLQPFPKK